jgi:restriction endonuclease S subunit
MIPKGWKETAIKDIAKVLRGASPRPKGDPRYYGGNVPRLMGADVTRDGKYVTPRIDFLTEEGAKLSRPMQKGTLVIVCSGRVGVPSILEVDCCIHDGFLALYEISESCNTDYLYEIFSFMQAVFFTSATHGGVFTNLTTEILREFNFLLPSLPEQHKIAEILGAWDKAITILEQTIVAKRKLKQGLMQQLLSGDLRFQGFGKSKWAIKKLGQVLEQIRNPVPVSCEGSYNEIGIRSHGKGIFYKEPIMGSNLGDKSVFWVEPDCFVVNIVFAWEQAVALTTEHEKGMIASHRFPMYQAKDNSVLLQYLLYFFLTPKGKYLLELASPGGAGRNKTLGQSEFLNLEIMLPSFAEQEKIAAVLSAADDEITTLETQLTAVKQQKRGLMQQLLTGKKRVKV